MPVVEVGGRMVSRGHMDPGNLFHALKRLWEVAHCLYAEESAGRENS